MDEPERISNDQERHVDLVCVLQDRIRISLDHLTRSENDFLAVEGFL